MNVSNIITNNKKVFFWNSIASILNSFQSAIILIVISHTGSGYDAGIFTFAYAVANLLWIIGKFGMRQFQVSDLNNKYSFSDYLLSRKITTFLMFVASILYILFSNQNNYSKTTVIFIWCCIRMLESLEDIYHGHLQKLGHLDTAAKIVSFRISASILSFGIIYSITHNLIITSIFVLIESFILILLLNKKCSVYFCIGKKSADLNVIKHLLIENLSLFLGDFCIMYLGNAPKYSIDNILPAETQAIFGYLFMPVFLTNMLCNFILQPLITTYSQLWHRKDYTNFIKLVLKHFFIIGLLTIITILGGNYIGIYLLEIIYNTPLQEYLHILDILLLSGGLLAFFTYFKTLLTVMRYQHLILGGYIVACIFMLAGGHYTVTMYGLIGISVYYMIILFLLNIFALLLILYAFRKSRKQTIT